MFSYAKGTIFSFFSLFGLSPLISFFVPSLFITGVFLRRTATMIHIWEKSFVECVQIATKFNLTYLSDAADSLRSNSILFIHSLGRENVAMIVFDSGRPIFVHTMAGLLFCRARWTFVAVFSPSCFPVILQNRYRYFQWRRSTVLDPMFWIKTCTVVLGVTVGVTKLFLGCAMRHSLLKRSCNFLKDLKMVRLLSKWNS